MTRTILAQYAPRLTLTDQGLSVEYHPWFAFLFDFFLTASLSLFLVMIPLVFTERGLFPYQFLAALAAFAAHRLQKDARQELTISFPDRKLILTHRILFRDFQKTVGRIENLQALVMKGARVTRKNRDAWLFGGDLVLEDGRRYPLIQPEFGLSHAKAQELLATVAQRLDIPLILCFREPVRPERE